MSGKIILFTEHFDIRHVADRIRLDRGKSLEMTLNGANKLIIVEDSVIYRRINGVYKPEKKEDRQAITASHIVMAYGPQEIIGYPPTPSAQDVPIAVKYRLTGLHGGLIGDISLPKGYSRDEVTILSHLPRKFENQKFIFLLNPRQGNGKDSFHNLFGISSDNPARLPWVLLNRTEYSVYAKSIAKEKPASEKL